MRIVCPNCEAKLQVPALPEDDTALKCPKCKELFYPSAPDDDDEDRPARRKKRPAKKQFPVVPVVCGISAGVALIAVVLVLVLGGGSKKVAKDDKPAPAEEKPAPKLPGGPVPEIRGLVDDLFKPGAVEVTQVAYLPTLEADGDGPEVPPFALPGAKGPVAKVPAETDPAKVLESVKRSTVFIKLVGGVGLSSGSGFVIRTEGTTALIATNHHVIRRATEAPEGQRPEVIVVFDSGISGTEQELTAEVVAQDSEADLAVLRVTGVKRMPAPIDPVVAPRPTETTPVLICGFPLGAFSVVGGRNPNISIGPGTVSSIRLTRSGAPDQVQIDGALNPGNSGGPVVDKATGRLVGVAVSTINREIGSGIGWAVPARKLVALLGGKAHAPEFTGTSLDGNDAAFRVDVPLADPLRHIAAVTLYVRTGSAPSGVRDPATGWRPMTGATKLELKVESGRAAVGQLKLRAAGKETPLAVQLACTGPDGAVSVSAPAAYTLSREGVALAGEVVSMSELSRDPGRYSGKVVVVRGKMKPTPNPRWNVFELDVTADNDVAPPRLLFFIASDMAVQMRDLAGVPVSGPVQLTCRVGKAGADGVAPVRVTRIDLLLSATGKPVRSIPPDRPE